MARYIDADKMMDGYCTTFPYNLEYCDEGDLIEWLNAQPTADVAPRAEVFEEVDKFKADLMDKFIDLCRGNDYNKLTLLKIGDVVDEIYDGRIAELKKKYTEGEK